MTGISKMHLITDGHRTDGIKYSYIGSSLVAAGRFLVQLSRHGNSLNCFWNVQLNFININHLIRAVEPTTCPSLTKGVYAFDYGGTAGMTPLMKMLTLGHDFIHDPTKAG